MSMDHGVILDDGGTIELELDNTSYNLDIIETINPGPQSEGQNYNSLRNKPQINSVTLQDNISLLQLGLRAVYYHTTAEWNAQTSLISEEGALYIYSDYRTVNETVVPGVKIGDGLAYVADLPFITDTAAEAIIEVQQVLDTHMASTDAHTTSEEKEFWNNKVSVNFNPENPENLILTRS